MERCPCGSGLGFKKCCRRFLSGRAKAATPLELMRSRYSAYATGAIDYIIRTTLPEKRAGLDKKELQAWSQNCTWHALEIVASETKEETGSVEFIARYACAAEAVKHHEFSTFKKIEGTWYYDTGTFME